MHESVLWAVGHTALMACAGLVPQAEDGARLPGGADVMSVLRRQLLARAQACALPCKGVMLYTCCSTALPCMVSR